MIATVILSSTAGEVLTAAAMKSIGDLDDIRAKSGMNGAIIAVVTLPLFFAGVIFLALAFFSLLFALNHLNLSLVGPPPPRSPSSPTLSQVKFSSKKTSTAAAGPPPYWSASASIYSRTRSKPSVLVLMKGCPWSRF